MPNKSTALHQARLRSMLSRHLTPETGDHDMTMNEPKRQVVNEETNEMAEEMRRPKLVVEDPTSNSEDPAKSSEKYPATNSEGPTTNPEIDPKVVEELEKDEAEFRAMRLDMPGVKGSGAAGIVSIGVSKIPGKNEFFRTHPTFHPVVPMVIVEAGMEQQFIAVKRDMVEPLKSIGITASPHTLYLTVTAEGAYKIIPIRCADADGDQNEYARTKEIGLIQAQKEWVRLYTDRENKVYKVFPAPKNRFSDPVWLDLLPAKLIRLAFRDKGWLIDSTEHVLFQRWAGRDKKKD
jgi:hypothetical protein